jgi:hypothetical protein
MPYLCGATPEPEFSEEMWPIQGMIVVSCRSGALLRELLNRRAQTLLRQSCEYAATKPRVRIAYGFLAYVD